MKLARAVTGAALLLGLTVLSAAVHTQSSDVPALAGTVT